jgi:Transposase Tn5 dimerisation domain/Transposase DNA-binding
MCEIIDELEMICFGDLRIDARAKKIIRSLFENIGNGFGASFRGNAEIKAAYRFFDNNLVNPEEILNPHYKMALERIKQQKVVVLPQDTTDIDMGHMESVEGLGVLNDTSRPGCSLHPVVAFTPDKLCLGVVDVKYIIRDPNELGKKEHNNTRQFVDKESYRWLEGYFAACKIAEQCPDTLCISIGDRESDIYELLLEATNVGKSSRKAELIIRAWHDRSVSLPPSETELKLLHQNQQFADEIKKLAILNKNLRNKKNSSATRKANSTSILELKNNIKNNKEFIKEELSEVNRFKNQLQLSPIIGTIEFVLPEGRGRKSNLVKQTVRAAEMILEPSAHKKNLTNITINAVLMEEIDPPEGEEPISWMFLTTLPITTIEEIQFIVKIYLSRWGIELFFKVLKSGCKIEELRFEEASRLLGAITVYMIVAWRILYTTFIGRACPTLPCSLLFELDEWQSVYAVVMKTQPPETAPSMEEFIKMIATLGGHRGRKSDGSPGMKTIWIGIQAMYNLAEGWQAYRAFGVKK